VWICCCFFFFQAEDGIRDRDVTGVQTCALPISSREHAPWALNDFGIRVIISTSFADIFYNNSFKNGMLPIRVDEETLAKLMDDAERGANATLTIDLEAQTISGPDGGTVKFDIDPFRKHCLLEGLDDIGLTQKKADKIDSYEEKQKTNQPWLFA